MAGEKQKDIIIGGAAGYTWDQLKFWVNSINKTDFSGEVVLVATDISADTIKILKEKGVNVSCYGEQQEDGSWKRVNTGAPHVERFFYIWAWLAQQDPSKIGNVVATDVRDVIFQGNPFKHNLNKNKLILSSEGLVYDDEPWGKENFTQAFGPFFYKMIAKKVIYNVGVMSGPFQLITDMFLMIFQMSINRPIQVVDQAAYNFLINIASFEKDTLHTNNAMGYAVQLGTTIEAVKAGAGDLGVACMNDPAQLAAYEYNYFDDQPLIEDGVVKTQEGKPFLIVHQYDRIPSLKAAIESKYD